MRRGIVYLYLVGLLTGISFTSEGADVDPKSKSQEVEIPQTESDSTEAPQEDQSYDMDEELESLNSYSELSDIEEKPVEVPESSNYYDSDEENDSSESMISFNFLYYLLQKFKFSNSLGY